MACQYIYDDRSVDNIKPLCQSLHAPFPSDWGGTMYGQEKRRPVITRYRAFGRLAHIRSNTSWPGPSVQSFDGMTNWRSRCS